MNNSHANPEDTYTQFIGKYVSISTPDTYWTGKLRDVDMANLLFILDESPAFSPSQQKVIMEQGRHLPIHMARFTEISKADVDEIAKEMGADLKHLNNWVKIGEKDYGQLTHIGFRSYTLNPALIYMNGEYHWETERAVSVPSNGARIIPMKKEQLSQLVGDSELDAQLQKLRKQHELKSLEKMLNAPEQPESHAQ